MSRKVFISFLGATNYGPCDYHMAGKSYGKERFIQVSSLRKLTQNHEWSSTDMAYILLTKDAESKNWEDEGQTDYKTKEKIKGLKGLQSDLSRLKEEIGPEYFPKIEPVRNLPDGNNEAEIWGIFNRVFEKIQKEDELYFDITHGYRYLPMLVLVLNNYAKFLLNVSVKSITYGNYEISNKGTKPGLIVDLLPLSVLQDWTFAAGQYMDNGEVKHLVDLSIRQAKLNDLMNLLEEVVKERQTCRGISLITSESLAPLKSGLNTISKTQIPPLTHILDKIKKSLEDFTEDENVKNGYAAAKWCISNKLYQQGVTILMETIFTDVCMNTGYAWKTRRWRDAAAGSFKIKMDNIPEERWQYSQSEKEGTNNRKQKYEAYKKMLASERLQDLSNLYNKAYDLRNDIDHAGMRTNARSTDDLVDDIEHLEDDIENLMKDIPC